MRAYLITVEDAAGRRAVVVLEAASVEGAERLAVALLAGGGRIAGGVVPSRLTPAMARALA